MKIFFSGLLQKARARGAYNTLDAMKLFAIFNMTADHIGMYFFPEAMWWRTIGRITFPVWFFLVGYSRSRVLGSAIWIYATLLVADRLFVPRPIFPMNALVAVIASRYVLNWCEERGWLASRLPEVMTAFFMLTLPTTFFFEYGSMAFFYALLGRVVYLKQTRYLVPLSIVSYCTFIMWQFIWFPFDIPQALYVVFGTAAVVYWLARPSIRPIWTDWEHSRWKTFLTVLSRNTLPYYFYHRIIFEVLAAVMAGKGLHLAVKLF